MDFLAGDGATDGPPVVPGALDNHPVVSRRLTAPDADLEGGIAAVRTDSASGMSGCDLGA
jgi:hypothetical protein